MSRRKGQFNPIRKGMLYGCANKSLARMLGNAAWKRGNWRLAFAWWGRHDQLVLLEYRR